MQGPKGMWYATCKERKIDLHGWTIEQSRENAKIALTLAYGAGGAFRIKVLGSKWLV